MNAHFDIIMRIFPILFICIFVMIISKGIMQFFKNERSPVISTNAMIYQKHHDTHTHTDSNGMMMTDDSYSLVFMLDTNSTIAFNVNRRLYYEAIENEWGTLTFQGTRLLQFESEHCLLDKT